MADSEVRERTDSRPRWFLIGVLAMVGLFVASSELLERLGFDSLNLSESAAKIIAVSIVFAAIYLDTSPARAVWWSARQETRRKALEMLDKLDALEARMKEHN